MPMIQVSKQRTTFTTSNITIKDLQMNLRRRLELLRILLLTPPLPQHAGPRRILVRMRRLVRYVHDLVPQDFAVTREDVQGRQVAQRTL